MPDQIDNVNVLVTERSGRVGYMKSFGLGTREADGEKRVPGTISMRADDGFEGPVTITVAGSRGNTWRTFREAVTTIPTDRVAELRMPVQWLCNESAMPQVVSTPDGKGGVVNHVVGNCDEGTTCKAGSCVPNTVKSEKLPDYAPENVFGGSADPKGGKCFNTVGCLSEGTVVTPDMNDCTIAKPEADADRINIGLRVPEGGICDQDSSLNTTCFVPLDSQDPEGWTLVDDGDRVRLPAAVCTRLEERKILAVYASTACPSKTAKFPPCFAASSVPSTHAIEPPDPITTRWPSAELVTGGLAADGKLCCPLMMDDDTLYTCACGTDGRGTLMSIDPDTSNTKSLTFNKQPNPAAVVYDQTLYWAAVNDIYRIGVSAGGAAPSSFHAPGTVYTVGMMLADDAGVYALTTGAGGDEAPVLLVRFDHDGKLESQDPLGNRAVQQFTQDERAFYLGLNVDEIGQPPFQRISSVVRIDKTTHARATMLKEQTMTITDPHHNGYLGVVSDGSTLFAQFETTADADGKEHLQIKRLDTGTITGAADPAPIYDLAVSPEHSTILLLLGAVDGAVIFAREELEPSDEPSVRSASIMAIPGGSTTAYYIADFAADAPAAGLAVREDRIFWLNQSGRLFSWDRTALEAKP